MKKLGFICVLLAASSFLFAQTLQLSDEEYAVLYFKKQNETQKRLTYINKKGSLAKIGTETISGKISGTLYYTVQVKGLGAVAILRYSNYCDENGWVFNGEIITRANMAQNGTLAGTMIVGGDYPGRVIYDNVALKDGKPASGTYGVVQNGSARSEVSYTVYFDAQK